jgi:hypothetical protein
MRRTAVERQMRATLPLSTKPHERSLPIADQRYQRRHRGLMQRILSVPISLILDSDIPAVADHLERPGTSRRLPADLSLNLTWLT